MSEGSTQLFPLDLLQKSPIGGTEKTTSAKVQDYPDFPIDCI